MIKYFFKKGAIFLIFFDEIKNTIEEFSSDILLKSSIIFFFFQEKNHKKKNWSEKPLIEIADITDDGPGMG